ncbi:MAG: response regulator [Sandaracinaceae bacterium]|nr:response regulator [Sandaracinaceae bacterium]
MEDDYNDEQTRQTGVNSKAILSSPSEGVARLVVLMGAEPGRRYTLKDKSCVVGRSEDCDVQVDDTKVSRRHLRIRNVGSRWVAEDLGSRNGTLVNGESIGSARELVAGDRIQLSAESLLLFTRQDPLEDLLQHRQQMEIIGHLAAGIAHDFNNLLNVIEASSSHLKTLDPSTRLDDDVVAECHADIRAASRRAGELTARLLAIAGRRDRADDLVDDAAENERSVDLSSLAADVLQLVRRTFGRSIEIESNVVPGLSVRGDYSALHQLLMNLCINARDAMPDGGTLTVGARREDGDEAWTVISVRDTGIGMDASARERVFDPFFTTKARGTGSGLGLATVYEVATRHGGTVEVESSPGAGSTFRVRLPLRSARQSTPQARTARRASTWDSRAEPKAVGRILVVDDQELVRRSLGRLLTAQGHDVLYASDGIEAVETYQAAEPRPDVVLMDLDMPRLSGGEALVRLRELDPGAKVVLISGFYDDIARRRLIRQGAVELLGKPLDLSELAGCIRLALSAPWESLPSD